MNKHAYLIIAHHQFELLELICRMLDDSRNDIYIHIDQCVNNFDFAHFSKNIRFSKLFFVDRVRVNWGEFSQVKAELVLLKAAKKNGPYSFYHLISGADMPLKSTDEIYRFFENNRGKEFVHYCTPEFSSSEQVKKRVKYIHLLQNKAGRGRNLFSLVQKSFIALQKLVRYDRIRKLDCNIFCGSNWFSISDSLVDFILSKEGWIYTTFSKAFCADELFLQTLIWDSPFRSMLYQQNNDGDYHSCMRFVDWNRGNPYTFRKSDFQELISSDYMFARKFDWKTDSEICKMIFEYVTGNNKST
jgi:hypothetical protein